MLSWNLHCAYPEQILDLLLRWIDIHWKKNKEDASDLRTQDSAGQDYLQDCVYQQQVSCKHLQDHFAQQFPTQFSQIPAIWNRTGIEPARLRKELALRPNRRMPKKRKGTWKRTPSFLFTRNKCHASSNKCLTSSNKKLLELLPFFGQSKETSSKDATNGGSWPYYEEQEDATRVWSRCWGCTSLGFRSLQFQNASTLRFAMGPFCFSKCVTSLRPFLRVQTI